MDERHPIPQPDTTTTAGSQYFLATAQTMHFFMFVIEIVLQGDYAQFVAGEALAGRELPKDLTPDQMAASDPGPRTKHLRRVSQAFLEMLVCRMVENFETYLSDLIREVLHNRPEMLRSQDMVKLEYLLQFDKMDDLLADLIDHKVNELGYLGFPDLEKWCEDRMGITVLEEDSLRESLIEFIETRNIIVHNRARVNYKYLRKIRSSSLNEGDLRSVDVDYFFELVKALNTCALSLDNRVAEKFSLSRTRLKPDETSET